MQDEDDDEMEVGEYALSSADRCLHLQQYGSAFSNYLLVMRLLPAKKEAVKENFTLALRQWGECLEKEGKIEELLKSHHEACELFPECEETLNNMGAQLFKLGFLDEAVCYIKRALRINPDYLLAHENLENVCSHLVERWHFRMLNDKTRNSRFKAALSHAVKDGYTSVLDIGSGTGLLSMFAVQVGASQVYGCEVSKTMYDLSCDCITANHMADKIQIIHKKSTDMKIPEDIPARVDLIVTETFDAGVFGENIISTLHHAWQHLLVTPSAQARVIPKAASVYICAIECEFVRRQNRFLYPGLRYLDLSEVNIVCTTGIHSDRSDKKTCEPYTSEQLSGIDGDWRALSEPTQLYEIDFNSPEDIAEYWNGKTSQLVLQVVRSGRLDALAVWFDLTLDEDNKLSSSPDSGSCWEQAIYPVLPCHVSQSKSHLSARLGDTLEVVASFKSDLLSLQCQDIVHLQGDQAASPAMFGNSSGKDEDSCDVEPEPGGGSSAGVCQVEHCEAFPSANGVELPAGESLLFDVCVSDSSSSLSVDSQDDETSSSSSLLRPAAPTPEVEARGVASTASSSHYSNRTSTSPADMCDVTSAELLPCNKSDPENTCRSCGANSLPTDAVALDAQPGCDSEMGTCANPTVKNGRQSPNSQPLNEKPKYCFSREEVERMNDLSWNQAYCFALERAKKHLERAGLPLKVVDMTKGATVFPLQALSVGAAEVVVIISDEDQNKVELIHQVEEVNNHNKDNLTFSTSTVSELNMEATVLVSEVVESCGCIRQSILEDVGLARMTCLHPDAVVLPQRVDVYGMVIESPMLLHEAMVISNDNTLDLEVAEFINEFMMTTHVDVRLSTLKYKKLSDPFHMFTFDFSERLPCAKRLPSYLHQDHNLKVVATDTGMAMAVVYWFSMVLFDDVRYCTLSPGGHICQAAVLQKSMQSVGTGEELSVRAACHNSCIHVAIKFEGRD